MRIFDALANLVIGHQVRSSSAEDTRRARLALAFWLVLVGWIAFFSVYYYWTLSNNVAANILIAGGAISFVVPALLRAGRVFLAGNVVCFLFTGIIVAIRYVSPTPGLPLPAWLAATPIIAMTLAGRRSGYFWLVCSVAALAGAYWIDVTKFPIPENPTVGIMKRFQLVLLSSLTMLITAIALIHESITETHLERLRAAQEKLVQAGKMSALGEMAAGIAHEINNPLAIIKTSAGQAQDLLQDDSLDRGLIDERLDMIVSTASRIGTIVLALKNYSRNEGLLDLQKERLEDILAIVESLCADRFRAEGIAFSVAGSSKTLLECRKVEITQVLLNLLNNAHDAVQGVESKWIKLECQAGSNHLDIRVLDSGPGIPVDLHQRIFEPFYTSKETGKGTGLGLSICQGFARANGAELFLDSAAENTCFVLRFPIGERLRQAR